MHFLQELKEQKEKLEVAKEKGDPAKIEFAEWVIGEELDTMEGGIYFETEGILEAGLKETLPMLDPEVKKAVAEAYRITAQEIRGREFIEKLKSLQ